MRTYVTILFCLCCPFFSNAQTNLIVDPIVKSSFELFNDSASYQLYSPAGTPIIGSVLLGVRISNSGNVTSCNIVRFNLNSDMCNIDHGNDCNKAFRQLAGNYLENKVKTAIRIKRIAAFEYDSTLLYTIRLQFQ